MKVTSMGRRGKIESWSLLAYNEMLFKRMIGIKILIQIINNKEFDVMLQSAGKNPL